MFSQFIPIRRAADQVAPANSRGVSAATFLLGKKRRGPRGDNHEKSHPCLRHPPAVRGVRVRYRFKCTRCSFRTPEDGTSAPNRRQPNSIILLINPVSFQESIRESMRSEQQFQLDWYLAITSPLLLDHPVASRWQSQDANAAYSRSRGILLEVARARWSFVSRSDHSMTIYTKNTRLQQNTSQKECDVLCTTFACKRK